MASSRTIGRLVVAGLLAGAVLASAVPGAADPMRLRLENLSTGVGVVITDNGAGDLDLTLGSIVASPALGLGATIAIGTSIPPLTGAGSVLNLNGVVVALSPVSVRFFLENDDYVGGSSVAALIGGTLQAGTGSTIALQSWLNPANLVPDLGADVPIPGALPAYAIPAGSLPLFGPAVFGPGAFADSETEPFTAAGAYSLFAEGTINFAGSGVLTATFSDTQAVVTPEPGSIVLLGVGLIALALLPVLRRAGRRQRGI